MSKKSRLLVFCLLLSVLPAMSQVREVTGTILDEEGQPMIGVTIVVEGTTEGTVTDLDGEFSIQASAEDLLKISFVGCQTQFLEVGNKTNFEVVLITTVTSLEEVMVVGYGQLKKESVVGAISQVKGDELLKTGGVTNMSNAITGLLPGVVTIQNSGEPGADGAEIFIRGQTTWNGAQPLILVDGVEREMNDIDPTEVESLSVLKDASATAVFGVKGANGVILVTTKRGSIGKPKLNFSGNATVKTLSRIPQYLGSYEGLLIKNRAIETEINIDETSWERYTPEEVMLHYRDQDMPYLFPDVKWHEEMVEDYAMSYRFNMNVSGGTKFVKYFGSLAVLDEGDILGTRDYGHGYDPGFAYQRYNFRSNLDFNLTKTTVFSVDLSGYYGSKKESSGNQYMKGVYSQPPDLYPVMYEDGYFAQTSRYERYPNPVSYLNLFGYERENRTQLATDFKLEQKLDFVTKGLSFNARLSYDNIYETEGVNAEDWGTVHKYIVPEAYLNATTDEEREAAVEWDVPDTFGDERHQFNYVDKAYEVDAEDAQNNVYRNLFYQFSLNYARDFGKHSVSGLALMNREETARGADFPSYREDWVGRVTYNYGLRYFIEANGAYNGSEKFGPEYRFGFFPSVALGWLVSNEEFFKGISQTFNKLKFKYSNGNVGSDRGIDRWLYVGGWATDNTRLPLGYPVQHRTDFQYREGAIANPDIHWEVANKQNIGVETSFLNYMLSLDFDYFWEYRDDIFMSANQRSVPIWFGAPPVAGNIGVTKSHGFEIELRFKRQTSFGLMYWANASFGYVKDEIVYKEDPELKPDYQKEAGFQIDQTRSQLTNGFMNNWDDIYTSTQGENNTYLQPGDYSIVDFNSDGIVNNFDEVPYAYPSRPQENYNVSAGLEWKGISATIQFYGVQNVTRVMNMGEFAGGMTRVQPFHRDDSWTPETSETATYPNLRYGNPSPKGYYSVKNASYLRLKTAEIAYNMQFDFLKRVGISRLKIFVNGNNLFLWTKMLEDREGGSYSDSNYPMVKRYNFGANLTF